MSIKRADGITKSERYLKEFCGQPEGPQFYHFGVIQEYTKTKLMAKELKVKKSVIY